MKKTKQITDRLNKLLLLNCEAEKLFLNALDKVENSVLKNFFRVSGYERNKFIKKLDSNIRQYGGIPTYPEEFLESENQQRLNEFIRNEEEKLLFSEIGKLNLLDIKKYQKALNKVDFPEAVEEMLIKQKDTIVMSLYSIEVHKDLFAKNFSVEEIDA